MSISDFKGWRAVLWPVHAYEAKKVLPLAVIMFSVLFNYTILRDVKDSLVITAPGSGAESVSFLKLWGTLPFAIIFMAVYGKLSSILSRPSLFYTMMMVFVVFYAAFGFVFFPMRDVLHADATTLAAWKESFPRLQWFLPLVANWTYSLFYIFAELWGTVALSVLFWQFANDITRVTEAKRVYPMFGLIGNFGLIASGEMLKQVVRLTSHLDAAQRWEVSLQYIIGIMLIFCFLIMYTYHWIQKNVLTDKRLYNPEESAGAKKKKKAKLSFTESLKVVFSSKYLGCLSVIILGYGMGINIVETTWKSQVKLLYSNPADYTSFMGLFSQVTGVTTILLMIGGANILRRTSWKVSAMITPLVLLVTGVLFFGFVVFSKDIAAWSMFVVMGTSPIAIAVVIGMIQNVMTKGVKYSLFDPTKEMAYIPLPDDLRIQGKAAVDGVGGRLGKSGGGVVQQILLVAIPGSTQIAIAPYLGFFVIGIATAWIFAVKRLSVMFEAARKDKAE